MARNCEIGAVAKKLSDTQARRNNRSGEEQYWRDYRTELETPIGLATPAPVAINGDRGLVLRVLMAETGLPHPARS